MFVVKFVKVISIIIVLYYSPEIPRESVPIVLFMCSNEVYPENWTPAGNFVSLQDTTQNSRGDLGSDFSPY